MEDSMSDNEKELVFYDSGIEQDDDNDRLDDPFNPEEISIDSKVVSMDNCLRRLTQGTITLNPDFQRKEVWTEDKKSQLIESLMLKIPLPMFYVSADEKNNYTVVDGLQRLSTIRSFILGDRYLKAVNTGIDNKNFSLEEVERLKGSGFLLQNLEFWEIYNGSNFNNLPLNIRNNILDTEFRFTVINPGTPEEVRRNIFKRINTGGLPLSGQEIRNALYIGQSTILLNELSQYPEFKTATGSSIRSLRMEDKELILRFLAFLIRDYSTYKKTINADSLMSDTMIIINSMPSLETRNLKKLYLKGKINISDVSIHEIETLKTLFKSAMTRAFKLFSRHTFRKSYGEKSRSPINKALFESWGVLLSKISEKEFQVLLKNKHNFLKEYESIIDNYEFQLNISRDSMKNTAVKSRFDRLKGLILKYSNDK
jgi:uncharacterized protein with ParB-like and HNH nuclease domain